MVEIRSVGQFCCVPVVLIICTLKNNAPGLVFNDESVLFAIFNAYNFKKVVYAVVVGGENIGDSERDGFTFFDGYCMMNKEGIFIGNTLGGRGDGSWLLRGRGDCVLSLGGRR